MDRVENTRSPLLFNHCCGNMFVCKAVTQQRLLFTLPSSGRCLQSHYLATGVHATTFYDMNDVCSFKTDIYLYFFCVFDMSRGVCHISPLKVTSHLKCLECWTYAMKICKQAKTFSWTSMQEKDQFRILFVDAELFHTSHNGGRHLLWESDCFLRCKARPAEVILVEIFWHLPHSFCIL
jgi:hypothetical protein